MCDKHHRSSSVQSIFDHRTGSLLRRQRPAHLAPMDFAVIRTRTKTKTHSHSPPALERSAAVLAPEHSLHGRFSTQNESQTRAKTINHLGDTFAAQRAMQAFNCFGAFVCVFRVEARQISGADVRVPSERVVAHAFLYLGASVWLVHHKLKSSRNVRAFECALRLSSCVRPLCVGPIGRGRSTSPFGALSNCFETGCVARNYSLMQRWCILRTCVTCVYAFCVRVQHTRFSGYTARPECAHTFGCGIELNLSTLRFCAIGNNNSSLMRPPHARQTPWSLVPTN